MKFVIQRNKILNFTPCYDNNNNQDKEFNMEENLDLHRVGKCRNRGCEGIHVEGVMRDIDKDKKYDGGGNMVWDGGILQVPTCNKDDEFNSSYISHAVKDHKGIY